MPKKFYTKDNCEVPAHQVVGMYETHDGKDILKYHRIVDNEKIEVFPKKRRAATKKSDKLYHNNQVITDVEVIKTLSIEGTEKRPQYFVWIKDVKTRVFKQRQSIEQKRIKKLYYNDQEITDVNIIETHKVMRNGRYQVHFVTIQGQEVQVSSYSQRKDKQYKERLYSIDGTEITDLDVVDTREKINEEGRTKYFITINKQKIQVYTMKQILYKKYREAKEKNNNLSNLTYLNYLVQLFNIPDTHGNNITVDDSYASYNRLTLKESETPKTGVLYPPEKEILNEANFDHFIEQFGDYSPSLLLHLLPECNDQEQEVSTPYKPLAAEESNDILDANNSDTLKELYSSPTEIIASCAQELQEDMLKEHAQTMPLFNEDYFLSKEVSTSAPKLSPSLLVTQNQHHLFYHNDKKRCSNQEDASYANDDSKKYKK